MLRLNKNRKLVLFLMAFFLVSFSFLFFANEAHAWWSIGNATAKGLLYGVNVVLAGVYMLVSALLTLAGKLFDFAIGPEIFTGIIRNNGAIYAGWETVRDTLNIAFILVLLYSAFCTVFQVQKYHLKNTLLMLVIMALLVNFSFPVSRLIIDSSNVMMYYFLNTAVKEGESLSSSIMAVTKFEGKDMEDIVVEQRAGDNDLTKAINEMAGKLSSIIFTFLLMVTMMVMAILLLIRIVVMAVLIIFSPVGFVAAIFPNTKKYADNWWGQLFKQAFFGPAMVFMVILSVKVMEAAQGSLAQDINVALNDMPGDAGIFKTILISGMYMSIPIVMLWIGLISAQKMGAYGADTVVKKATDFAKGAGKKFSGYNWANRRYEAYKAERKKRSDEKLKGNWGTKLGNRMNRAQDWTHGTPAKEGDEIKDSKGNVIGHAKSKSGRYVPGAKNAKNRHRKMLIDKNKEDIKSQHEDLEGAASKDMYAKIASFNAGNPNTTHEQKIEAAAHARQALSRGKEYEDYLKKTRGLSDASIAQHRQKMRDAIKAAEFSKT